MLKYLLAVACVWTGSLAKAEEYVLFFTATGSKNVPNLSHTWATFTKTGEKGKTEARTISWLPKTRKVNCKSPFAEEGVNLDGVETLRWAKEIGSDVKREGPYRVKAGLYELASTQADRLESGFYKYKCVDTGVRPRAVNCTHAVTDLWVEKRPARTGVQWGQAVADDMVEHFSPWYLTGGIDDRWLLKALRVEGVPAK